MGLKLQKARGTKNFHGWLPHFYGQYRDGKAIRTCALKTRLRGVPPVSGLLTDPGDAAFEAAKALAEQELAKIMERAKDKNTAIAEGCSLLTQATGQTVADLRLSKLAAWYRDRKRTPETDTNRGWLDWHDKIIQDFADWARAHKCGTVFEVTRELAQEYATTLAKTHARGTLKAKVYWLAGAFRAYLPNSMKNPFDDAYVIAAGTLAKEDGKRVFRKPLDAGEIMRLWEAARREGSMWYEIAVCATCTGMRIGDVCNLQWRNVDLRNNCLPNVPTAKTGVTVTVPLFDYVETSEAYNPILGELRRVLDAANTDAAGKDPVYVFPEAHMKYTASPSVISARGKLIFARALFGDAPQAETVPDHELTVEEIQQAIAAAPWTEAKRTRIAECYKRHAAGENYPTIAAAMNYPAYNRISMDLAEVERLTGAEIRPRNGATAANSTRTLLDKTREQRTVGARSASVYGWHSLRHAWVVLMMEEGVQFGLITKEDVQAVVGHTTFAQTLEYYNPTDRQRVERMRKGMGQRARKQRAALAADPGAGAVVSANALAGLTDDQRAAVAALLKSFAVTNGNGGAQ